MTSGKKWKRPESATVPTVWARFESRKPMPNGRTPKFRIQDYTEEWREQVLHNMVSFFLKDEPLSKSIGLSEDRLAVEEFVRLVLEFLDRKTGLVAVVENPEELGDDVPVLAGCNITGVVSAAEEAPKTKSENLRKILDLLEALEKKKDCFEHYGTSDILFALGLSVNPAFRGHGLGCEILKARFPLCQAVGIKATATVFTAGAAQRSAEKAGFETLAVIPYVDYKNENGRRVFEVEQPESAKLMGVRVPS